MAILLVRHGETALNASRVIQPSDTPLGERGLAQAAAVARRLAERQSAGDTIGGILSSDMPRALQTAQAIGHLTGAAIETTPLLHERNFGDWRGKAYHEVPPDSMRDLLAMRDAPPGGESSAQFRARVAQAWALAVARAASVDGDLVVVSHGLVIRALLDTHIALGEGEIAPGHMLNTSVCIVDGTAPHRAALVNCVAHLTP